MSWPNGILVAVYLACGVILGIGLLVGFREMLARLKGRGVTLTQALWIALSTLLCAAVGEYVALFMSGSSALLRWASVLLFSLLPVTLFLIGRSFRPGIAKSLLWFLLPLTALYLPSTIGYMISTPHPADKDNPQVAAALLDSVCLQTMLGKTSEEHAIEAARLHRAEMPWVSLGAPTDPRRYKGAYAGVTFVSINEERCVVHAKGDELAGASGVLEYILLDHAWHVTPTKIAGQDVFCAPVGQVAAYAEAGEDGRNYNFLVTRSAPFCVR